MRVTPLGARTWAYALLGAAVGIACAADAADEALGLNQDAAQEVLPLPPLSAVPSPTTDLGVVGSTPAPVSSAQPTAVPVPSPPVELSARTAFAGRLTAEQYQNAVLDVLGVELTAEERTPAGVGIPREKNSAGLFRNGADGQAAADDYPLAFGRLAASVAGRADLPGLQANISECTTETAACRDAWVSTLGRRLLRRPLNDRESSLYQALHDQVATLSTFEQAQRSVLEALLQAPSFLFRLEQELTAPATSERYLNGFELASRLSFFLWNSVPDEPLLQAAEQGALQAEDPALTELRAQTERMLADPKARRMTQSFLTDFAETERASFVGITDELRAALVRSLQASFDKHLWEDGKTIAELFVTTEMQFEPPVAELIGLSPSSDELQTYDVSGLPERVGWLTHPGFIAGMGEAQVGSLVTRGITLMVKLMCRQPLEIPADLSATIQQVEASFGDLTQRQRSEQRQKLAQPVSEGGGGNPACCGCHSQFEPLAYGFDRFDAAGRDLGEQDAQGRALPIDGWLTDNLSLPEQERPRYENVAQQMALMAASDVVQQCMTEHFVAYATGRAASSIEKAHSSQIHAQHRAAGGTLSALVLAITTSELFRKLGTSAP